MTKLNKFSSFQVRGFTLVELMVTLVVLATLVVVAVPSLTGSIQRGRLTAQINQVTGLIAFARSEAAKRPNTTITLCGSNNTTTPIPTCNSAHWEDGWLIMSDANADRVLNVINEDLNGDGILDAGEDVNANGILDVATDELLQIGSPLDGGNSLRSIGFTNNDFIQFSALGIPDSSGTFVLCDKQGAKKAKAVVLSVVGRTRLAVDENTSTIVNDDAGVDVACP